MFKKSGFIPALCLLLALAVPMFAALEQSGLFYVNDSAEVLADETAEYICDENYRMYYQCKGSEVVVVTVDFLDGMNAEEYGYTVYNDWGIGGEASSGVLILLSPGEEKYWVTVGDGLSGRLTAGKLDTILAENMEADFDSQSYDAAVLNTFKAIVSSVNEEYGVTASMVENYYSGNTSPGNYTQGYQQPVEKPVESDGSSLLVLFLSIFGIVIVILIFICVFGLMRAAFRSVFMPRTRPRYGWRPIMPPRPLRRRGPMPHDRPAPPPPRNGGGFFGWGSSGGFFGGGSSHGGGFFGGGHSGGSSFGGGRPSGGGRIGGGGGSSRGGGAGRR